MKFTAPPLGKGKRAALEKTKNWLANLLSDLQTKKARLDELDSALQEAQLRKNRSEKDAALKPDAALALAGAEAQLSRLAPQVNELHMALQQQTEVALRQANTVRSIDVREVLYAPFIEQLNAAVATALRPFFDADWAKHYARQVMQSSNQWRQIMFYLNRSPVVSTELDVAKREINALVSDIEKILAGGTLIEA
jgi:hypothetical protein